MPRYKTGSAEERRARYRKMRVPGETIRRKLSYPGEDGYEMRWANDKDTRITDLLERGWDHVLKDEGKAVGDPDVANEVAQDLGTQVSRVVGAEDDGRPIKAYLMKIRKDWYEEDRKAKDDYLTQLEKQIKDGSAVGGHEIEHKYIPSGGTKIERG